MHVYSLVVACPSICCMYIWFKQQLGFAKPLLSLNVLDLQFDGSIPEAVLLIFLDYLIDFFFVLYIMYGASASAAAAPGLASAVSGSAPASGPPRDALESRFA